MDGPSKVMFEGVWLAIKGLFEGNQETLSSEGGSASRVVKRAVRRGSTG